MAFTDPRLHDRRRLVAQLYVRQYTTRQIADALSKQGWRVSHMTVVRDLAVITAEWRRAYAADMAAHKARELAKLDEVEKVAWQQSPPDLNIILRTIDQRCKLLGLYDSAALPQPVVDVEKELAAMGYDAGRVIADVERYLDEHNPETGED